MPCKGRRKDGPGSAAGTLWVQALVAKYGRQHMAAIGRLGAQALLDRHGCEHMQEIGRAGYWKVMRRSGLEPIRPIPWNERRWQALAEPQPEATQITLFDLGNKREAA